MAVLFLLAAQVGKEREELLGGVTDSGEVS
jgi:hypothetical protein